MGNWLEVIPVIPFNFKHDQLDSILADKNNIILFVCSTFIT